MKQRQKDAIRAARRRGWITLEELLQLASNSPVDQEEAEGLAGRAGIRLIESSEEEPWSDLSRLAQDGPDAFREVREGPPAAEEIEAFESSEGLYLREISRRQLLTAEEEVELARARDLGVEARRQLDEDEPADEKERERLEELAREGLEARRRLIESNLRLVVSVAKKFIGRGLPFLDLVQEGNIGLQKAADRYEWQKGFRFSTYAYWWIRQAVGRSVAEQGRTIRLPGHIFEQLTKLYNVARTLEAEIGRSPTPAEIGEAVGLSVEKVQEAFRAARIPISLEKPVGDDASATLGDLVADVAGQSPAEEAEESMLSDSLEQAMRTLLTARETRVVRMRFGLDRDGQERTLGEVGQALGMSRERARQIEAEALRKLRHAAPFRQQFRDYTA